MNMKPNKAIIRNGWVTLRFNGEVHRYDLPKDHWDDYWQAVPLKEGARVANTFTDVIDVNVARGEYGDEDGNYLVAVYPVINEWTDWSQWECIETIVDKTIKNNTTMNEEVKVLNPDAEPEQKVIKISNESLQKFHEEETHDELEDMDIKQFILDTYDHKDIRKIIRDDDCTLDKDNVIESLIMQSEFYKRIVKGVSDAVQELSDSGDYDHIQYYDKLMDEFTGYNVEDVLQGRLVDMLNDWDDDDEELTQDFVVHAVREKIDERKDEIESDAWTEITLSYLP